VDLQGEADSDRREDAAAVLPKGRRANQPILHDSLVDLFTGHGCSSREFGFVETKEKGHGREEIRRAWVSSDVGSIPSGAQWSGLATLVRVETVRTLKGKSSRENRHFIGSRARFFSRSSGSSPRRLGNRERTPMGPRRGIPGG